MYTKKFITGYDLIIKAWDITRRFYRRYGVILDQYDIYDRLKERYEKQKAKGATYGI